MRGVYCDHYHNPLFGACGVPTVEGLEFTINGLQRIAIECPHLREDALELIRECKEKIIAVRAWEAEHGDD